MKVSFLVFLFFGVGIAAHADVSCSGDGYSMYMYPGATPTGERIPVGEANGPNFSQFMKCDWDYTYCSNANYVFSRTVYDARLGRRGQGLIAVMQCSK